MIQAIQTSYKGYRFRSRLEARWAVFFDAMGLDWRYEHQGYSLPHAAPNGYLPDFQIFSRKDVGLSYFVEIKPIAGLDVNTEALNKCIALSVHTGGQTVLFLAGDIGQDAMKLWINCDAQGPLVVPFAYMDCQKTGRLVLQPECLDLCFHCEECRPVNAKRATQGYAAARAARFEHGETPGL